MTTNFAEFFSLVLRSIPFLPNGQERQIAERELGQVAELVEIPASDRQDHTQTVTAAKASLMDCIEWWHGQTETPTSHAVLAHLNRAFYFLGILKPVEYREAVAPVQRLVEKVDRSLCPSNIGWPNHSATATVCARIANGR